MRGYKEEGTTTTPFDMTVMNDLDRFHLAMDVIDRVSAMQDVAARHKEALRDRLIEHKLYIARNGDDMPEIKDWRWPGDRNRRSEGIRERITMKILVLNGGSSTLKATLRELDGPPPATPPAPLWEAQVEWGRQPGQAHDARARAKAQPDPEREIPIDAAGGRAGAGAGDALARPAPVIAGPHEIDVVGHRVVHGGNAFRETTRITPEVKDGIRK